MSTGPSIIRYGQPESADPKKLQNLLLTCNVVTTFDHPPAMLRVRGSATRIPTSDDDELDEIYPGS